MSDRLELIADIKRLKQIKTIKSELARRERYKGFVRYFPDEGNFRRELYTKHLEFFRLGKEKRQRCVMAANRVGKTETMGGYEMTCHLTGLYPSWWEGRRFDKPVTAWAAGDTAKTVRDIIQQKLFGSISDIGSGLIPKDCIVDYSRKAGVPDAIELAQIRHTSGLCSTLNLKSYDQRRISFQGTEQDVIWLDEEPDEEIYTECLLRTMTNNGMIMATFTPLSGRSSVVNRFEEADEKNLSHVVIIKCTWDDVPHLSEEAKSQMLESCPPHQRDARSKGLPSLGSGSVYPVPQDQFLVDDFVIPKEWPRCYGMDVGWNWTAVVWGALNPADKVLYIYSEMKQGGMEPYGHAAAINARGKRIKGAIDPASQGRSQVDGRALIDLYRNNGLDLTTADNRVETGINTCYMDLCNGQLKVFKSCVEFQKEFRVYQRDSRGNIKKENDHLMDAFRYCRMTGKAIAKPMDSSDAPMDFSWMTGSFG